MTRTFSSPFPTGQTTSANPLLGRWCGLSGHVETWETALPQMLQKEGSEAPQSRYVRNYRRWPIIWVEHQWG